MPRLITPSVAAEIAAGTKRPCFIVDIQTQGDYVRLWSGSGTIVYNGENYLGVGTLGSVSSPQETTDLRSVGIVFSMSGIDSANLANAIQNVRANMPAKMWMGFLDEDFVLIDDPVLLFEGTTGVPSTDDSGDTCSLSLSAESMMASLKRPRVIRMTPEDQANRDETDKGFAFVASLQDKQLNWGRG